MSGEPVRIEREVLRMCYADAAQAYPEEACGLLLGPREAAVCDEARWCKNQQNQLHADDPQTYPRDARMGYNLSRADVEFLDRSLQTQRPVKVIYHSHVDVGAYFSAEDQRAALMWGEPIFPVDYLVIDCGPEGVRCAKLYRFADGAYAEVASYPGQNDL